MRNRDRQRKWGPPGGDGAATRAAGKPSSQKGCPLADNKIQDPRIGWGFESPGLFHSVGVQALTSSCVVPAASPRLSPGPQGFRPQDHLMRTSQRKPSLRPFGWGLVMTICCSEELLL